MSTVLLQAIINGLLLGGVYAAYSAGFSLIFGVMGVVNLAHGELIMLGAFTSYWMFVYLHMDPYWTIPFAMAFLFVFGYLLQKYIINRVIEQPHIMSYILTFGIHLMVANLAVKFWTHDFRSVTTSYSGLNAAFWGLNVPLSRLITFCLAILVVSSLWFFLARTETGRAIRATSMDKEVARLMGVDIREIYAVTFGIGAAITGLAGASMSPFVIIFPEMGLQVHNNRVLRRSAGRHGIHARRAVGRVDPRCGPVSDRDLSERRNFSGYYLFDPVFHVDLSTHRHCGQRSRHIKPPPAINRSVASRIRFASIGQ